MSSERLQFGIVQRRELENANIKLSFLDENMRRIIQLIIKNDKTQALQIAVDEMGRIDEIRQHNIEALRIAANQTTMGKHPRNRINK